MGTRRSVANAMSVAYVTVIAGCAAVTTGAPASPVVNAPMASGISISGNLFYKNGVAWTPRALQINAFVASPSVGAGVYLQAYQHFTLSELNALQPWGADTVRFQVGQPEMDPQSSLFSQSFVAQLQAAVTQARAVGLIVILSLQDEAATGEASPASLPDAVTARAWATLATIANGDQNIVFDLFSEPSLTATSVNWASWQTAFQALINSIRATGAKNVLLASGLQGGTTFAGAPTLSDPLGETGYAVEPWFFSNYRTTAAYDIAFGNLAATNAVLVDAWSTLDGGGYTEYCGPTTPADAQTLLNYLATKKIGLTGFAFDDPGYSVNFNLLGTIVQDLNGTPTTFAGGTLTCGQAGFGPGTMIQGYFKTGIVPAP